MGKRLTIKEIVNRLGIAYDTFYGWRRGSRRRRPLPVHRERKGRGVAVHVLEDDLIAFLAMYRPDLLTLWQKQLTAPKDR